MSIKKQWVMGHRGVPSLAPENTLGGFRKTASLGVEWVELDVTLLSDGTVVVHHDGKLGRCSDGEALLSELTLADIADIHNAKLYSHWPFEPIPTLAQVLDVLISEGMSVNIEIKQYDVPPEPLVSLVLTEVTERLPLDRVILSSFDMDVLALCKQYAPDIRRAAIVDELPENWRDISRDLALYSIHCDWKALTQSQVEAVKHEGYELLVWTVNEPAAIQDYWQWGLSGVISDYPQRFISNDEVK